MQEKKPEPKRVPFDVRYPAFMHQRTMSELLELSRMTTSRNRALKVIRRIGEW